MLHKQKQERKQARYLNSTWHKNGLSYDVKWSKILFNCDFFLTN